MLSGFNTNFRYRGVLFHVQTEDSGIENPHVITHLFHGGNIMASNKRDYSMLLDDEDMETAVRKLMEGQHKSMLKQLSRGEHDAVIGQRLGSDIFSIDIDGASPSAPPEVTEDAPPLVVAEYTQLGADSVFADSMGGELILEPEFAQELSAVGLDATDSDWPATRGADSPSAWAAQAQEKSTTPASAESEPRKTSHLSRVFGDRVVSEKPLDEVVLDYLVKNARKRKRQPK